MEFNMVETIKSLQSLIITALIIFALLLFRNEVKKLVDWIVSFKKLSKTKNGYQASAELEPSGLSPKPEEVSSNKGIQKMEFTEHKEEEKRVSWVEAFFKKEYDKAIEVLKEDIEKETVADRKVRLKAFIGAAKFKKDKQIGIEYFEDLIREQETQTEAYYWYAWSYYSMENYETAITVAKRGIDAKEGWPELHELYADCLVYLKREIEAIEFLAENLNRYPETASSYLKIADILIQLGMKDLARDCCRAGITYCPTDVRLLEKYADILSGLEQYKESMIIYRKLTAEKPEEPKYLALLGNQYLMIELNDLALEAYKEANQLANEKQGWIISNIGNLIKKRGFYTEGASYLKKAIEIEPDSQYAHERLAAALKSSQEERNKRDEIFKEIDRQMHVSAPPLDTVIQAAKAKNHLNKQSDAKPDSSSL